MQKQSLLHFTHLTFLLGARADTLLGCPSELSDSSDEEFCRRRRAGARARLLRLLALRTGALLDTNQSF